MRPDQCILCEFHRIEKRGIDPWIRFLHYCKRARRYFRMAVPDWCPLLNKEATIPLQKPT